MTNGHVDVIRRAAEIFDRVVVGVVGSPAHKQPMFNVEERVEFLEDALSDIGNVEVDVFKELVVDFARRWDAKVIVKGLRVISDFEWELQMNQLNRTLAPDIETVYVMASPEVSFVSSSGVKEIAAYGGDVDAGARGGREAEVGRRPGCAVACTATAARARPVSPPRPRTWNEGLRTAEYTLALWTSSYSSTSSTTSFTTPRPCP